jgi:alpha-amylase/alpha-mannosidase (GH57 family)
MTRQKKIFLLFWWHMHQPLYKNPQNSEYELPWTLIHSIKDYFDVPDWAEKFEFKMTFNITPVLLDQIQEYSDTKKIKCKLLQIIKRRENTKEEDEFVKRLVKIITPYPKSRFSYAEKTRDLALNYLISWCGENLKNSEIVKNLSEKKSNYSDDEVESFILEIEKHIKNIIPKYKKLKEEKIISVSISPYYHPITPLLFDIEAAKEGEITEIPNVDRFLFYEDAKEQINKAKQKFEKIFGELPSSMWPSEGAVSEKMLEEISDIKFIATDEKILFKSREEKRKDKIYCRFLFKDKIFVVFRDTELSDLISFSYHSWDQKSAVQDFILRLKGIYDSVDFSPLVSIILDGENCWEYYPENGKIFMENLLSEIKKQDWIEPVKIEDIIELEGNPIIFIDKIKAGSWIDGKFSKWIGTKEKNSYWEKLAQARKIKGMTEKILVAEGSDWFWWQGENPHQIEFLEVFDKLFNLYISSD